MTKLSIALGRLYRDVKKKGLVTDLDFLKSHKQVVRFMDRQKLHGSEEDIFLTATEHCLALAVMRKLRGESSKIAYGIAQIVISMARPLPNFLESFEPLLAEALEEVGKKAVKSE